MATIQLKADPPTIVLRPQSRVSVRRAWTSSWQIVTHLEAIQATDVCAPSIPTARFRFRGGDQVKRADRDRFETWRLDAVSLAGQYVMIEVVRPGFLNALIWVGVFADADEMFVGGTSQLEGTRASDIELLAYGLAHELDRQDMRGSWATNNGSDAVFVDQSLTFNADYLRGFREFGNRSPQLVSFTDRPKPCYLFASDYLVTGNPSYSVTQPGVVQYRRFVWTAADIIGYLINLHFPRQFTWVLGGQTDLLDAIEPSAIQTQGVTVWQLLNQIVDRRRGMGFKLESDGDKVMIKFFSLVGRDVKIDRQTLKANPDRRDLRLADYGAAISERSVRFEFAERYSQVEVRGQPIVVCVTVSVADGNLVKGWTDAEEERYRTLQAASPGERSNDAERAVESLEHVFARFVIPEHSWHWQVGNGRSQESGILKSFAHAPTDADGTLQILPPGRELANFRAWGHQLLRTVPFERPGRDPEDSARFLPEFREPFAFLFDEAIKQFRYVDLGAVADSISGHFSVLDRDMGFTLRMYPNHQLARNHWDGASFSEVMQPKYDYTTLVATVAARQDVRLRVIAPIANPAQANETAGWRSLVIDVPDAETWWMPVGTVYGLKDGKLLSASSPRILRDDAPRLRQIAAFAKAWYGDPHAVMSLTAADLWTHLPAGAYIGQVAMENGREPVAVNSCVTEVIWDLEAATTHVTTDFGQFDFASGAASRNPGSLR